MYELVFLKQPRKKLFSLSKKVSRSIIQKMEEIAKDPYKKNNNVEKLQGVEGFRLRQGDWRVIYKVEKAVITVVVVKIESRGEVYKK
ncbi:MAG: cytotoxin [Nitrospinae bacterium CG11_big_fil_rev_8_21_14_0_20_56_8]|nr:MAG: cytotoxin [Nitrospinae bacterium CG11_big_fil_rev_8_21_14_0_20_56_8]